MSDDKMVYHSPREGNRTLGGFRYPDSLFFTKLFVTKDGRKRGLWVWIEDEVNTRLKQDQRVFEEGLVRFRKWLDDPDGYKKNPEDLRFQIKQICFSYFFAHRTEAAGIRLSWHQVKRLAQILVDGEAKEEYKTEAEDYFDPDRSEEE